MKCFTGFGIQQKILLDRGQETVKNVETSQNSCLHYNFGSSIQRYRLSISFYNARTLENFSRNTPQWIRKNVKHNNFLGPCTINKILEYHKFELKYTANQSNEYQNFLVTFTFVLGRNHIIKSKHIFLYKIHLLVHIILENDNN